MATIFGVGRRGWSPTIYKRKDLMIDQIRERIEIETERDRDRESESERARGTERQRAIEMMDRFLAQMNVLLIEIETSNIEEEPGLEENIVLVGARRGGS